MKRSKFLQPLSREHHAALVLAKACERAAQSEDEIQVRTTCKHATGVFRADLEPHFQIEEASLLPMLFGTESELLADRTLEDHKNLRSLINMVRLNDAKALGNFGKCLSDHVRFEERDLFPVLEGLL